MRAQWEALHASLVRSVRTLSAHQQFNELRQQRAVLSRFEDPVALLDFLTGRSGDLDEKDDIYRVFVELAQLGGDTASLATSLLWLGLWPGLDAIFRRRLRHFASAPAELVSEIGDRFTHAIHHVGLDRVRRMAATLVRNTERDVRDSRQRDWADQARKSELPDDDILTEPDEPRRAKTLSDLGIPPGLSPEQEVAAIRDWLVRVVGGDADLVIGAAIYGDSQRDAGELLGLTHDAARKRFQRALPRLRTCLRGEP